MHARRVSELRPACQFKGKALGGDLSRGIARTGLVFDEGNLRYQRTVDVVRGRCFDCNSLARRRQPVCIMGARILD